MATSNSAWVISGVPGYPNHYVLDRGGRIRLERSRITRDLSLDPVGGLGLFAVRLDRSPLRRLAIAVGLF